MQSAVFAAEVAAYYKAQGITLYEGLIEIFEKYGYYQESSLSNVKRKRRGRANLQHPYDIPARAATRNSGCELGRNGRIFNEEAY